MTPVTLPSGWLRLLTKSRRDRIEPRFENDRNDFGCRFRCQCRGTAAGDGEHRDVATNQLGRERRQSAEIAVRPPILDDDITAFVESRFAQALTEGRQASSKPLGVFGAQIADDRHRLLLRARSKRPDGYAGEKRDEFASPHCCPRGSGQGIVTVKSDSLEGPKMSTLPPLANTNAA